MHPRWPCAHVGARQYNNASIQPNTSSWETGQRTNVGETAKFERTMCWDWPQRVKLAYRLLMLLQIILNIHVYIVITYLLHQDYLDSRQSSRYERSWQIKAPTLPRDVLNSVTALQTTKPPLYTYISNSTGGGFKCIYNHSSALCSSLLLQYFNAIFHKSL